jgi:hypothetical protein
VQFFATVADGESQAGNRLAISLSETAHGALADAFTQHSDDFNLLGLRKDIHGGPNPSFVGNGPRSGNLTNLARLATIPGIGPIIATAIAATIADPNTFRSGREFAAWLGLVPRQNSTGGKARLGGISKRGDSYLRRLLVNSAHTVLLCSKAAKNDPWLISLLSRKPRLVAAVALANKTARVAWAIMSRHDTYRHVTAAA